MKINLNKFLEKFLASETILDQLAIGLFTIILLIPLIIDTDIIKTNDLIGNISHLAYIQKSLLNFGIFPLWNPLLNLGIPIFSDPLSSFLNPLVFISYMFLPPAASIKIIYIVSAIISGSSFYIFGRYFKISRFVLLILSFTYVASGYFASRIFAGHLEKILAYPFIPLILLSVLKLLNSKDSKRTKLYILLLSTLLTLLLLSGSIYEVFYIYMVLISVIILILMIDTFFRKSFFRKDIKSILSILFSFILVFPLGAIKLLPIFIGRSYIQHINNPFLGSQNPISIIYNFFLPNVTIFATLGLSNFLVNNYGWWESLSYIGPASLFFFVFFFILVINRKIKLQQTNILLLILITSIAVSMVGYKWNPFYWIFTSSLFLQQFRIPSRIFIIAIPIILIMVGISSDFLQNKSKYLKAITLFLLIVNLYLVVSLFHNQIKADKNVNYNFIYSRTKQDYPELLDYIHQNDKGYFFIAQSSLFQNQLPAYKLVEDNQILLNSTYGYGLKSNKSSLDYSLLDFKSNSTYSGIYPKYFVYPKSSQPPTLFKAKLIKTGADGSKLFENTLYTPFVFIIPGGERNFLNISSIDRRIKSVEVKPNLILAKAESNSVNLKLIVAQSQFPGWRILIDGRESKFINDDFLSVSMQTGLHSYAFEYNLDGIFIGAFVSFISITVIGLTFFTGLVIKRR